MKRCWRGMPERATLSEQYSVGASAGREHEAAKIVEEKGMLEVDARGQCRMHIKPHKALLARYITNTLLLDDGEQAKVEMDLIIGKRADPGQCSPQN